MTSPIGGQLQWMFGKEAADQQPGGVVTKAVRLKGISGVVAKRPYEKSASLDARGQNLKGYNLYASIQRKYDLEPKADDIVFPLAHQCGWYDTPTDLTGAYQWSIRPFVPVTDTAPIYLDTFHDETDLGDSYPVATIGQRISDLDLSVQANKIVSCSFTGLAPRDTYLDEPDFDTDGGTYTGYMSWYGHPNATAGAYTTFKVKCTTPGALDGTAKVSFTHDAVAYGATEYAVTAGTPIKVYMADGSDPGVSYKDGVYVVFSSGGTLSLNDEWSIDVVRVKQTASYTPQNPFTACDVTFTIGGTSYNVHNISLKCSHPLKANQVIGAKYASTIQNNGKWQVSLTLDRDAEDVVLLKNLIRGAAAAVVLKMQGDLIGATAHRETWEIDLDHVMVSDATRDVSNDNTLPEKIGLEAFTDGTDPIIEHLVTCTFNAPLYA